MKGLLAWIFHALYRANKPFILNITDVFLLLMRRNFLRF